MRSWGGLALASRLRKLVAVAEDVLIARSKVPLPLMSEVTSVLTQAPEAKLADVAATGPIAGAFE